jgi:hypothetical protein
MKNYLTWEELLDQSEYTILKQLLEYIKTTNPETLLERLGGGVEYNTLGFISLVIDEIILVIAAVEYYDEHYSLEHDYVGSAGWVRLGQKWVPVDESLIRETLIEKFGVNVKEDFLANEVYRALSAIEDEPQVFIKALATRVV